MSAMDIPINGARAFAEQYKRTRSIQKEEHARGYMECRYNADEIEEAYLDGFYAAACDERMLRFADAWLAVGMAG